MILLDYGDCFMQAPFRKTEGEAKAGLHPVQDPVPVSDGIAI